MTRPVTVEEVIASRPGRCRSSCGARVVWATTRKGNPMLVDVGPADGGNVELVVERGLLYADVHGQPPLLPTVLRHSHMETCPNRDEWRRRR